MTQKFYSYEYLLDVLIMNNLTKSGFFVLNLLDNTDLKIYKYCIKLFKYRLMSLKE